MNKTDWVDEFKTINSRIPNDEEIVQALARGNFSDTDYDREALVETSKPVRKVASNYLTWVWHTVKHPMTQAPAFKPLYSYLTLGIIIFFSALALTLNLHDFYEKKVIKMNFSDFSSSSQISAINVVGFGTFITLLFATAIYIFTLTFSTWFSLKLLNSKLTFSNIVDQYTSLFVPAAFFIVLAAGFGSIRLNLLSYVAFSVGMVIISLAFIYIALSAKCHIKLDDFYTKLLALITSSVIMYVIIFMLFLIFTILIFKSPFANS